MIKLFETIKNIFSIEELRDRIINTVGFLIIFRLGSFVVLPGIDTSFNICLVALLSDASVI